MGQCFKTVLPQVVNNDELPIFGGEKLKFIVDKTTFTLHTTGISEYEIINGTLTSNKGTQTGNFKEWYQGTDVTLVRQDSSKPMYFILKDKYVHNMLNFADAYDLNIEDFKYHAPEVSINMIGRVAKNKPIHGNINELDCSKVNTFILENTRVTGNIMKALKDNVVLNTLSYLGSIDAGTWEEMVEGQCALGRTSGTITVQNFSGVKMNNIYFHPSTIVFSDTGAVVTGFRNDGQSGLTKGTYTKSDGKWVYE